MFLVVWPNSWPDYLTNHWDFVCCLLLITSVNRHAYHPTMRQNLFPFAQAAAAATLLSSGALAARPCGNSSTAFQYRLGDVRYDGPDPSKNNGLATIAASLQGTGGTPLFECVGQWPEAWQGWYEGESKLIWADCIYTGAGLAQDKTVSFAVDWKKKTMYLAHTFACSDKEG
jgi:hypothetical protein